MRKATHSGECQICGATQKLPGNRLSLHGYTTKWGFFSGVCNGAEAQPFELSKDLIAAQVDAVKAAIVRTQADLAELATTTAYAWVQERVPGTHGGPGGFNDQRWRKIARADLSTPNDGREIVWTGLDGKTNRKHIYGARSLDEAVMEANEQRAHEVRGDLKQMQQYVEWQTRRMADWAPHPEKLIPVGSGPAPIQVGDKVLVFGREITIKEIRVQQCRGAGPSLNGRHLPHAIYESNGKEYAVPMQKVRRIKA